MRNLLATAVALAPLLAATGVQAEVVISTARTSPIVTSNATGSGPDDIRFTSAGSIAVSSGVGATVDSDNDLTLESGSAIRLANSANGSTGVLVQGGVTSDITIGGAISVTDDITDYPDTDGDGDQDGPIANGQDRVGLRVAGAGGVTGDITVANTATITADGEDSYGISLETPLTGNLTSSGTIGVYGTNTIGVRTTSMVDGDVAISGTVAANGEGAAGVAINGEISGALTLQGAIGSTGYRFITRPSALFIDRLDPDDLLQSGSAVVIGANVDGGVLFDRRPTETDPDEDDEDGDGIVDTSEATASINTYGSAPAVVVGSDTNAVALGAVGTGDAAYGFINRGSIQGSGVYDAVDGRAVLFGGAGQAVVLDGGLRNEGTITALSQKAQSTGIEFGAGTTATRFDNTGSVIAGVGNGIAGNSATGLLVDSGATLTSITNSGQITGTAEGGATDTTAIRDLSGTLTTVNNTGSIRGTTFASAGGQAVTGQMTAIDVAANTTGVTVLQNGVAHAASTSDPDTDGDGVSDAYEPILQGDIRLGSGADTVDIRNGTATGAIAFGQGADSLSITGGAVVRGAITDSDGRLDIRVADATLDARQTTATAISNLDIEDGGVLLLTLDPGNADPNNNGFVVSGTANLAAGAGIGVRFAALLDDPQDFRVIQAGVLNAGDIELASTETKSPYLFMIEAPEVRGNEVYISARRRSASEAGLIPVEAQAFDRIYDSLDNDSAVLNAFLSQTERDGFINLYEQMLPDHSGGPLLSLASGVDAVTKALTGRNASAAPGQTSAWAQEINFYADKDKTDTYGFRSEGFGVAAGVERGTNLGAFGVSTAFTSSDIEDPESEAEEVLSANLAELGLYWRAQGQYWTTWARAAGGYASFSSTRQLVGSGLNLKNTSDWHGFTLALAGGASYEREFGRINVRPEIYAEYFSLNEDAHTEQGGGDGFDLDIDDRKGHMFSATAAMNIGYGFGQNGWLRPELRVGWRQNISVDPGETIARFANGSDFSLTPADIEGGGPIIGFNLSVGNALGKLSITGDAELIEDYVRYSLLLRASFRF